MAQPRREQGRDTDRDTTGAAPVSVVIADDRALARAGMRAILTGRDEVAVAGAVTTAEAASAAADARADVLMLVVSEHDHDAFRVAASAKALHGGVRVVAVAEEASLLDLREAVMAGVDSFLLTSASADDLVEALIATARGERVLAPEIALQLAGSSRGESLEDVVASITPRELEVLELLAEGLTNRQIAGRLGLSTRTVKTHVQKLLAKLDAPDRTGAVARGFRLGLLH